MHPLKPPRLHRGDTVGIVAPSFPLLPAWRADYERGKDMLRAGLLGKGGAYARAAPLLGGRHAAEPGRRDHSFPILANVDFGHQIANIPLPIGIEALLDAEAASLTLTAAPLV